MNKRDRNKTHNRKLGKRLFSILMAVVVFVCGIELPELSQMMNLNVSRVVYAAAPFDSATSTAITLGTYQEIINYSNNFNSSHVNDTITIALGNDTTSGELAGFTSIGSASVPFGGKIILSGNVTLNLPVAMFGGITDDVAIVDADGNPATLVLTRTKATPDEPLFAKTVVPARSSGSADWRIQYSRFYDESNTVYQYSSYDCMGFIGTMEDSANVKLTRLVFDNLGQNDTADIVASTGDVGLVCCEMKAGAVLEVD